LCEREGRAFAALLGFGLTVVRVRFIFSARLIVIVHVFLFFSRDVQHAPPHEVTKADITH
jgi:hypothetical protein